jgi:hypothetical protein
MSFHVRCYIGALVMDMIECVMHPNLGKQQLSRPILNKETYGNHTSFETGVLV